MSPQQGIVSWSFHRELGCRREEFRILPCIVILFVSWPFNNYGPLLIRLGLFEYAGNEMRPLESTSLLRTRLSNFLDGMKTKITIELLPLRSSFGTLHRGNCIKHIILVILHTSFGGVDAFSLYPVVKITLLNIRFRCFSVENVLDIWDFELLSAPVGFLSVF